MRSLIAVWVALQRVAAGQSACVEQVAWLEHGAIQGFNDSRMSDQ